MPDASPAVSTRTAADGRTADGKPREPLAPVRALMALARLDPRHHVAVLGQGGLDIALALWRAGFTHVDVAPARLSRTSCGTPDAVVLEGEHGRIIEEMSAARRVLRVGGWLIVHVRRSAVCGLAQVRVSLKQAGFAAGPGVVDADGAWIVARSRTQLRLL